MSKYEECRRTPAEISKGLQSCIRQLRAAHDVMGLTPVSEELKLPIAVAMEHLKFLEADLQADLDHFNQKYGIVSRVASKGMR